MSSLSQVIPSIRRLKKVLKLVKNWLNIIELPRKQNVTEALHFNFNKKSQMKMKRQIELKGNLT